MTDHRATLFSLQQELSDRITKIDKDLHSRLTSAKFSDQVVDRQNDDVLLNLKNEAAQELEQIQRALAKIEQDKYGICENCYEAISPERLNAIPFAAYCKDCAV
jgi:RNA polymerase-binding transcription factor DksA